MRLTVNPVVVTAAIGDPVVLSLEVYNTRPVIDGYRVSLLGLGDIVASSDPPELSLFPETAGTMVVVFTLPAGFPAGQRVIGLKAASVTDPRESAVVEVTLDVAPVTAATLTAEPLLVTAGRRAEVSVTIDNRGNVPLDTTLAASDATAHLHLEVLPAQVTVPAGAIAKAQVVGSGRRPWFGSPVPRQVTVMADTAPAPMTAVVTVLQKPVVPRGALTLLSVLAAIALWGLVLLVGVNMAVDRLARSDEEQAVMSGPLPGGRLGVVAGTVTALPDAEGTTVSLLPLPSEAGGPAPSAPAPVVTPANGEYRIEGVEAPGTYQVVFSRAGFGTQSKLVELSLGQVLEGVDANLLAGSGSITGTVADGSGPLGAVSVTADNGTSTVSTVTASSGPVGTFVLAGLPPGTWAVDFAKDGFGSQSAVVAVAPGQAAQAPPLTLTTGRGSVSGTVFDQTGAPLPDVMVSVSAGTGAVAPIVVPGTSTSVPPATTTTSPPAPVLASTATLADGPVGAFALSGLPTPGAFTVTFQKPGFLPATATVVLADNGNETGLSPILRPVTGSVSGLVTEQVQAAPPCGPGECPLPGVTVTVTDRNGSEVRTTMSADSPADMRGRYEIAGLTAGTYSVTFSRAGYSSQTFSLVLADNQQNPLDVALQGAPVTISGSAPLCAAVAVVLRDGSNLDPPLFSLARPDGTYRVVRVPTPGEYRVVFVSGNEVRDSVDVDLGPGEVLAELNGSCPPPVTIP